jgi:predicted Co/Zn/Cd cation transporter (cation efflux family)
MLFGLAAIVLGIFAQRDNFAPKSDLAIAGIVVGAVGFALGIAVAVCYIIIYDGVASAGTVSAVLSAYACV